MSSSSKLTPCNYATWKEKIKEPLVEKGLLCYVTGATKKYDDDTDDSCKEEWSSKQEMALGTLLKNILDPVKYHIRNLDNPIEVWGKLEAL